MELWLHGLEADTVADYDAIFGGKGLIPTIIQLLETVQCTVDSRYLKLRYLEFCETRSIYLNHKYILIAFSNHNLALSFLHVQITRSAN